MDDDHFESQDQQSDAPIQRCGAPGSFGSISLAPWTSFRDYGESWPPMNARDSDRVRRGPHRLDRSSEKPGLEDEPEHTGVSSGKPIDWEDLGGFADIVFWTDVSDLHRWGLRRQVVYRKLLEAVFRRFPFGPRVTIRQRPQAWVGEAVRRRRRTEAALQAAEASGDKVVQVVRCNRPWRSRPKA